MEFKQMKFRIKSPEQFAKLTLTLKALGWELLGAEVDEWIAYRKDKASFVYCNVAGGDFNPECVVGWCNSEDYFNYDTPHHEVMDADSFIHHHFLTGTCEVSHPSVKTLTAKDYIVGEPHVHRDIMIALANDSSTIVEVLRRDGKWAVTDSPVFNPHQQFRIGKSNLDRLIDELIVEIGGSSGKLNRVMFALSAGE